MKINKNYNNEDLKAALADSKDILKEAEELLLSDPDRDDKQLYLFERYKHLPQFERDLLILTSKYPVTKVAELYGVTISYVYIRLKKIQKMLNEYITD